MEIRIIKADVSDSNEVAAMVKELTDEIVSTVGGKHFNIDVDETAERCGAFISEGRYSIFLAVDGESSEKIGFLSLTESNALYAEGAFGIVQELYVKKPFRSRGAGHKLIDAAVREGRSRGWKRIELCTPPVPHFEGTVRFYEGHNFEVTGGKKMKLIL